MFSENLSETFKLHSNLISIAGTVPEGLCTLMIISRLYLLRIRHVSEKFIEKKFHVQIKKKKPVIYEIMWKNRASQRVHS